MSAYLFILCPPYAGSTVLWNLVATSEAVSALPGEGQALPEVEALMRHGCWSDDQPMPWSTIKPVWDAYWDQGKPLLLEKSPPNILRAEAIAKHFSPIYFLIMVRNPYAHCEGLIRRNRWPAERAARFVVRCLRQQMKNAETLANTLCLTYEDLVADPAAAAQRIQAFIPRLGTLVPTRRFKVESIDGEVERTIVDLNKKKIYNLTPGQIERINHVLSKEAALLEYWGYVLYSPPWQHRFFCAKTKAELLIARVVAKWKKITGSDL